jgi:hypothetical protein
MRRGTLDRGPDPETAREGRFDMTQQFPVIWRMLVTERMAADVNIAAAEAGLTRRAWLRSAIEEKLARQRKAKR